MALQAGTLMVTIRAQDYASRTLRRVSGEFGAMSRAQKIAAMGEAAAAQKSAALGNKALAESNIRRLRFVRNSQLVIKAFEEQRAALDKFYATQALATQGGRFRKGVDPAVMRQYQNAGAAVKKMGLRGVAAYERLAAAAHEYNTALDAVTAAQRKYNMLPAAVQKYHPQRLAAGKELTTAQAVVAPGAPVVTELKNAERALKSLGAAGAAEAKSFAALESRTARLRTRLAELPSALRTAAVNQRAFGAETYRATQALAAAEAQLSAATKAQLAYNRAVAALPSERLASAAHAISGVGRTLQLFGAVGTLAFGAMANMAANFNTQVSLAATQARNIGASAGQVQQRINQISSGFDENGQHIQGVLDLMKQYPATADDMTQASYDIFSGMDLENKGVIDVAKGLELLKNANQIAVAGGVDLKEATSAMITVLNNFDPQLQHTTKEFDTMFDIVRFGRMTLSDFNVMMNKIAPAAADAGNTLEDVGGAMAYLTTVMPSQRMVATGISRLLEFLRHPDTVAGLHKFGVEAKTMGGQLRPLPKILADIAKKFPQVTTGQKSAAEFFREITAAGAGGGKGIIGTQEGRRAFSEIMTHQRDYEDSQRRIQNNQDEFAKSQAAQMKAMGVQWAIFKNQVKAVFIAIGHDAIPVFAQLGKSLQKFLDWWQKLNPETRKTIVQFGVLVSVGALLGGVFLAVLGSFMAFEAMIARLLPGLAEGGGALKTWLVILRRLSALALIVITIKLLKGGEPSAWDLLMGGAAGAAAGSRFGPAGAAVGAVAVPAVEIAAMTLQPWGPKFEKMYRDRAKALLHNANAMAGLSKEQKKAMRLEAEYDKYIADSVKTVGRHPKDADKRFKSMMTFKEYREFKETMKSVDAIERNRTNVHNAELNKRNTTDKKAIKKYKDALGQYYKLLQDWDNKNKDFARRMKEWQAQLANATEQAAQTAVDNLRTMYLQLLEVNKQIAGEFLQGPWLTSETFDLAQEWGITPRVIDVIKDLRMQNVQAAQSFALLRKAAKMGIPKEILDAAKAMPADQRGQFLETLTKAKPGQVQAIIREVKKHNKMVTAQTKIDFRDEIERFRKAGGDMGAAIIDGFQDALAKKDFDNWVKQQFPNLIIAATREGIRRWIKANPKPINQAGGKPKAPPPPKVTPQTKPRVTQTRPTPKPSQTVPRVPGTRIPDKNAVPKKTAYPGQGTISHSSDDHSKHITYNFSFTLPGGKPLTQDQIRKAAFMAKNAVKGTRMPN